jgi:uncharacterized membrane protein (UPF0127 family)
MKNRIFSRNFLWIVAFVLLAALALFWKPLIVHEPKPNDAPSFPQATLTIQRADGHSFPFTIEVATTREQEKYGLMFRHALPQASGMIFLYNSDQVIHMWMKNTYIPLDMLFVRHDGTIARIVTHTKPFDLTPISSGEPVRAVIEMNAGVVDQLHLGSGDKVIFPGISDQL